MDERALEELCKWHDEQAAMLRSEAGNLPAAAVAAEMHAKTGAEPGFSNFDEAGGNKPDRSIGNIPAPIFWSLAIGQVVFLGWLIFQTLGWL